MEEGGGFGLAVFVGDGLLVGEGDFEVRDGEGGGDGEGKAGDGVADTVAVTVTATGGALTRALSEPTGSCDGDPPCAIRNTATGSKATPSTADTSTVRRRSGVPPPSSRSRPDPAGPDPLRHTAVPPAARSPGSP
ncbi:hypothetical protein ACWDZW_35180, partial [Streptomyces coeruleorubidus]